MSTARTILFIHSHLHCPVISWVPWVNVATRTTTSRAIDMVCAQRAVSSAQLGYIVLGPQIAIQRQVHYAIQVTDRASL